MLVIYKVLYHLTVIECRYKKNISFFCQKYAVLAKILAVNFKKHAVFLPNSRREFTYLSSKSHLLTKTTNFYKKLKYLLDISVKLV